MSVEPAPRPRLRRRLRAPLLRGAVRALGLAPETWLRAGCGALARPLTHTTPGKRALANLELVLGDETSRDQRTALRALRRVATLRLPEGRAARVRRRECADVRCRWLVCPNGVHQRAVGPSHVSPA